MSYPKNIVKIKAGDLLKFSHGVFQLLELPNGKLEEPIYFKVVVSDHINSTTVYLCNKEGALYKNYSKEEIMKIRKSFPRARTIRETRKTEDDTKIILSEMICCIEGDVAVWKIAGYPKIADLIDNGVEVYQKIWDFWNYYKNLKDNALGPLAAESFYKEFKTEIDLYILYHNLIGSN